MDQLRINEPSEAIDFEAHAGRCRYCGGIVKMCRDPRTMQLLFDDCRCLLCGQAYVVLTTDAARWEETQWLQKRFKQIEREEGRGGAGDD